MSDAAAVVIKKTSEEVKIFRFVRKGIPFWYKGDLCLKTSSDSHNAIRLCDGCSLHINSDVGVIPTTIQINVA